MGHEIFTKELEKQLTKTTKSHSKFVNDNSELKRLFKTAINSPTLGTIVQVVIRFGYKDEKDYVKEFYEKVDANNFDDVDVEIFKNIVNRYIPQVMDALENKDWLHIDKDNGD